MTFRIIPKLDIKNNNLVKGINMEGLDFDWRSTKNNNYFNDGADEIILHDCIASLYKKNNLDDIVENYSKKIFIPLTIGGGIKTQNDIIKILSKGADRVSINSFF